MFGCGQPHNVHPTAKIYIVKYPICLRVLNAGHVAVGPDQIGLVAADNRITANHRFKFRAIGASSSGLRSSFAARTVGDWNQLPAVVVEQESPAAFKSA